MDLKNKIYELALPLVEALGLEIWGLEAGGGPRPQVRLYIEVPQQNSQEGERGSPTIDQCETVSRQLGLALEVEDCIKGPWNLEVSTPGLERRFFSLGQLRGYTGDLIDLTLKVPLPDYQGRKAWRGVLREVGPDFLVIAPASLGSEGELLLENAENVKIPWDNVRLARRMHVFAPTPKPGKKNSRKK